MKTCHGESCHSTKTATPVQRGKVALIGLERVNDLVIRQYAIDNDYITTTQDADFYEMSLIHGSSVKFDKNTYFINQL